LSIDEPPQEQTLEKTILRSGGQRLGDLMVLKQWSAGLERAHGRRAFVTLDVEEPDARGMLSRCSQHRVAEEWRVGRDDHLSPLVERKRQEQLRDQLQTPRMDAILRLLECDQR